MAKIEAPKRITPQSIQKKAKTQAKPKVQAKPKKIIEMSKQTAQTAKSRIGTMKAILDKQPRVSFMIPLGIGEKPGAVHEVGINGYNQVYPKGKMIEVPQSIYELLASHFNITSEVGQQWRLDRTERRADQPIPVSEALS